MGFSLKKLAAGLLKTKENLVTQNQGSRRPAQEDRWGTA